MASRAKRLQAAVWRGGGVGVLAGLLLLPLHVGAVGSGDLDASFGDDGTVLLDFEGDTGGAVAIQADGKIVVAGDSTLARFLPNGALDATFGGDGTVRFDFGSSSYDAASAVALQTDGKIVVAGWSEDSSRNYYFALARYLPNGTLDATFSGDGKVLTNFGSNGWNVAQAVALQADGKIVVGGGFALARYLPNGTLDPRRLSEKA